MKLTELSKWHLTELEKLSKVVPVEIHNEYFEFWSGNIKLSNTKIKAFEGGFTLSERYDNHVVEKPYGSLTDYFYCG